MESTVSEILRFDNNAFTQPFRMIQVQHKVIFNAEFNRFEFSAFLLLDQLQIMVKKSSLPYYLPIAGGRILGFIPFLRVLVLCEMQTASFRILNSVQRVHFL